MENKVQFIGMDIGRGYAKGYTVYNNKELRSIIQAAFIPAFSEPSSGKIKYDSFYFKSNGEEFIVGEKAFDEGNAITTKDNDKTGQVTETLIQGLLAKIGVAKEVIIGLGIPNIITDEAKEKIENFYTGKKYIIEIEGKKKEITIKICACFREADAVSWLEEIDEFLGESENYGIVSLGFRTIEQSYYKEGVYIESKSRSKEDGNVRFLDQAIKGLDKQFVENEYVADTTKKEDVISKLDRLYSYAKNNVLESYVNWIDKEDLKIVITGGLVKRMGLTQEDMPSNVYLLKEPEIASAKGLYKFLEENVTFGDEDEEK